MRIELRDGMWAELRERITHGQDKEILRARARGKDDEVAAIDVVTVTVRQFLRDWYVNDPDGNPIPASDPDAIERAPDDIVDKLTIEAIQLYTGATLPNALTPPSSDDSSSDTP